MDAKTDQARFAELYDYYFPKVYAFVASKVDKSQAEDLVSEVFMKIVRYLPKYEWRDLPFGAWVFRIARNIINDHYRNKSHQSHADIEDVKGFVADEKSESPEKSAHRGELKIAVSDVLEKLSDREAEVIRLKFFSELSNKEISKALKITESNVGVIVYRTLKLLKPELENYS